jgi:sulfoxide reductase catalytic subunit YedY
MLIRKPDDVRSSEITPKGVYVNRRLFMRTAVMAGTVAGTAGLYRWLNTPRRESIARVGGPVRLSNIERSSAATSPSTGPTTSPALVEAPVYDATIAKAFNVNERKTPLQDITHYNNFYEFSTDKLEVAYAAQAFVSRPWKIEVGGLCRKPRTFDFDDLMKFPQEERTYRMRCVEKWSMVIPWVGFPLSSLLNKVEPTSAAKFVRFQTLLDPNRMPNQRRELLDWPYVEGLRLDEAMHPLAILATGLYDEALRPQNGAPVRLVVPWKYGFKGIKSIVKIDLVASQPTSTWTAAAPHEYGFYCNVNPDVRHPRWRQDTERRIGDFGERRTLLFNGYGEQVAHLYSGMDLRANF